DHPVHTTGNGDGSQEETLFIDLSGLVEVTDSANDNLVLENVSVGVIDDTPVAAISPTGIPAEVDESAGQQADEVGALSIFGPVSNPSSDLPSAQYAQSSGAAVSPAGSNVGADAPGTTEFSLEITDSNSGLTTTDGHAITLVLEGGLVVGRIVGGAD